QFARHARAGCAEALVGRCRRVRGHIAPCIAALAAPHWTLTMRGGAAMTRKEVVPDVTRAVDDREREARREAEQATRKPDAPTEHQSPSDTTMVRPNETASNDPTANRGERPKDPRMDQRLPDARESIERGRRV